MASRWVCALMALIMVFSLAGCGNRTAGTNASRWWQSAGEQNNALYQRELSDGAGDRDEDWRYRADGRGQVKGFDSESADRDVSPRANHRGGQVENDLKDAGSSLKNAVRDAARSVGDRAEDAMDGMKNAARNASDSTK